MPSSPTTHKDDDDESSDSSSSSSSSSSTSEHGDEEESTWGMTAAAHRTNKEPDEPPNVKHDDGDGATTWQEPNESYSSSSPPDKERQLLLLMLLAQVCALHDPTPRTFTVHVLELFERGILDRESIRFLFELGLVPHQQQQAPLLLLEQEEHAVEHCTNEKLTKCLTTRTTTLAQQQQQHFVSKQTPSTGNVMSHEHVRIQEASAIRSHLEEKAAAAAVRPSSAASFPPSSTLSSTSTSWAVEHHPLSLSRYQREFQQVCLLNSGSFGHVYQATHLMDGRDYAIKRVTFRATGYSSESVTQAIREVQCLAQCHHPHCVQYYTSWLEPSWMTGSGSTTTEAAPVSSAEQERFLLLTNGPQPQKQQQQTHMVGVGNDGTNQKRSSMSRRFSFTGHYNYAEEGDHVSEWSSSSSSSFYSSRVKDDSYLGSFPGSPKQQQTPGYHYEICLFIQMELCNPSTLADWIRNRNHSSTTTTTTTHSSHAGPAIHIFSQLVRGIQHVHEKGIVHRDLKPANIFLGEDGRFKIGDFGLSKLLLYTENETGNFGDATFPPRGTPQGNKNKNKNNNSRDPWTAGIGTASYAAPEQLTSRMYGTEADVFSMGLILLELVCSFGTEHERIHTFQDCRRHKLPPWLLETYPDIASVILRCTQSNPAMRPTASDLVASSSHNVVVSQSQSQEDTVVLQSELEKKDEKLKRQRCEIEEKDRIIEDLRRQVERMNSRQNDKDDNIQEVTKEMMGVVESTSFSEEEDY